MIEDNIMKKKISLIIAISATLGLSSCGSYTFKTNLDPQNFVDYYKISTVKIVDNAYLEDKPYIVLANIKGLSCQMQKRDMIANETDARIALRQEALKYSQANAVLLGKCIRIKHDETDATCLESVTCYGQALRIDE